jgi:hypothetical protein
LQRAFHQRHRLSQLERRWPWAAIAAISSITPFRPIPTWARWHLLLRAGRELLSLF